MKVDQQVYDLAVLFLEDCPPEVRNARAAHAQKLAEAIQTAIEDYLNDIEK